MSWKIVWLPEVTYVAWSGSFDLMSNEFSKTPSLLLNPERFRSREVRELSYSFPDIHRFLESGPPSPSSDLTP
jgi:hypothetical protein